MTLAFDWLAKRAALTPDRTALVDAATGREYTYREFDDRAGRLARFWREEWSLAPGDRVAILGQNSSEYFEALFAAAKAEVVLVPLNWRLAVPELEGIVADSEPGGIVYDGEFADEAATLVPGGPSLGIGQDYEAALASSGPMTMPARPADYTWEFL